MRFICKNQNLQTVYFSKPSTLATELKHTNEHLARHEQKIDAIEGQPRMRMQQIVTAIIAALAGGLISAVIGMIVV